MVSTSEEARAELGRVGLTPARVEPVAEQGWASWTYELDGALIVRFPRNDDVVEAMHREMRLLPALAEHVSFRVPVPLVCAEDWFVYEKIPGRPLTRDDDIDGALAMIDELHTFPIEKAQRLLDGRRWTERLADDVAAFEADALPLLDDELRAEVEPVLHVPPPDREVLIHYDLGPEHILVDDAGSPVGIIDFEEAIAGDPAADRMPTYVLAGRPLSERMWAFHCRGTLHALVYYAREGLVDEVPGAFAELRRRLDLRPGQ